MSNGERYAVGFARPDRGSSHRPADESRPWHAVAARRDPRDMDGEVAVAVCGCVVQVWGSQRWERVGALRTACPRCRELAPAGRSLASAGSGPVSGGRRGGR